MMALVVSSWFLNHIYIYIYIYIYIFIYVCMYVWNICGAQKGAVTSTGGSRNWVEWPRKVQANRVNYFASPIDMFAKGIEK
jgi:hypothetical protein